MSSVDQPRTASGFAQNVLKFVEDDAITYSVSLLLEWKKQAEARVREDIERGDGGSTMPAANATATLSAEALELLLSEPADLQGMIFAGDMLHSLNVSSNNRQFVEPRTPRNEAKWRSVVKELLAAGLIATKDPKRQIHRVTEKGYIVAEAWQQGRAS